MLNIDLKTVLQGEQLLYSFFMSQRFETRLWSKERNEWQSSGKITQKATLNTNIFESTNLEN